MPKTRLTGFSRLLIFLLFALPLVYAGASYYNGEDPIANAKNWLGMNDQPPASTANSAPASPPSPGERGASATFENVQDLRNENERLRRDLAVRTEELARCRAQDVN